MIVQKPNENTYPAFYRGYVGMFKECAILEVLTTQKNEILAYYQNISQERGRYAYAEGKWTVQELLGHIIDTERVFAYRLMCISRGDKTCFPSFEQDDYMKTGNFNNRTLASLIEEFDAVRTATVVLVKNISQSSLDIDGEVKAGKITPRALLYIIAGHAQHHFNVLKQKYEG